MRSSNVIGIPESSEAFEVRCAVLFRQIINDPGLKGVATSGANQEGIDLIGARDGDPGQPVSVQCKLKKGKDRLSVSEAMADTGVPGHCRRHVRGVPRGCRQEPVVVSDTDRGDRRAHELWHLRAAVR